MPPDAELPAVGGRASRTGTSSTRRRGGWRRGSWRPTPASPSTPTTTSGGWSTRSRSSASSTTRWCSTCSATTGRRARGDREGTVREHLVGHGFADDTADMDARAETASATRRRTPIYPVGWALAMNTPYQWTKQVASHFGGTRDGLVVHWPGGIGPAARCGTSSTTSSTCCRRCSTPRACRSPTLVDGVPQQPVEGTSDALHLRRPGRPGPPHARSTSRWSATAGSTTRAGPR